MTKRRPLTIRQSGKQLRLTIPKDLGLQVEEEVAVIKYTEYEKLTATDLTKITNELETKTEKLATATKTIANSERKIEELKLQTSKTETYTIEIDKLTVEIEELKAELKKANNIISDLRTEAIKDRHWKKILKRLSIHKNVNDLILDDFLGISFYLFLIYYFQKHLR